MQWIFSVLILYACISEGLCKNSNETFSETRVLTSDKKQEDVTDLKFFKGKELPPAVIERTNISRSVGNSIKGNSKRRRKYLKRKRSKLNNYNPRKKKSKLNEKKKKYGHRRRRKNKKLNRNVYKTSLGNTITESNQNPEVKLNYEKYLPNEINYSELMNIQTTTMPPPKNLSLETILQEFNTISNQIEILIPGEKKYPKFKLKRGPTKSTKKCRFKNRNCSQICNPDGTCSCVDGFKLRADQRNCIDINECDYDNGGCKEICFNTPGSYFCACPSGLRLSDDKESCEDINECLLRNGHGPCQDTCKNIYGSYKCSCLDGTRLAEDKHSCEDINECKENRADCSHGCVNTLGRAFCTCPEGMELSLDWKTCHDINECEDEAIKALCKYGCENSIGSFRCVKDSEFQSDQAKVPDDTVCPPLFPPKYGYLECFRENILKLKLKTKNGRLRVTNKPGTFCQLICPTGYRKVGVYKVTCNYDGNWTGQNSGKCSYAPHPKIKCPDSRILFLNNWEKEVFVTFEPPITNIDWKYVTASPLWVKELKGNLPQGYHLMTFTATDPVSQITARCSFEIQVKKFVKS